MSTNTRTTASFVSCVSRSISSEWSVDRKPAEASSKSTSSKSDKSQKSKASTSQHLQHQSNKSPESQSQGVSPCPSSNQPFATRKSSFIPTTSSWTISNNPSAMLRHGSLPVSSFKSGSSSVPSVLDQVRHAREISTGALNFFRLTIAILFSTFAFTILLCFLMIVPASMILVGVMFLDDCPAEPLIPIFLVSAGAAGGLKDIYSFIMRCNRGYSEPLGEDSYVENVILRIVNASMFGWFVAGCVWIYRTTDVDTEDKTVRNYCNKTLYHFAFWLITAMLALTVGSMLCGITIISFLYSHLTFPYNNYYGEGACSLEV